VQVEHVEEKENDNAENDDVDHEPQFDDNGNHFVPPSPPVLQQQNHSIAADRPRRTIAPRKRLIEESNIVHYAKRTILSLLHILKPLHLLTARSGFLHARRDAIT
jgi:hypothetical protein